MTTIRSLTFVEQRRFEWRERPAPVLRGPAEALVRPVAASICDIDRPLIVGAAPWEGPFAFGHECVAQVVDVGDDVTSAQPGDLVAVTWHINCGGCDRCLRGLTAHCRAVPPNAMFGLPTGGDWGGFFDDLVRVPYANAMLTPVPPGVSAIDAVSAGDNLSLGYQIMSHHLARGVRRVLVLGSAAVGMAQVAFAVALGASEVVYIDDDPGHRKVAESLGGPSRRVRTAPGPPTQDLGTFDLVVDASFRPQWLRRGLRMTEPEAVVECLGGYFHDEPLPLFAMYVRAVTLRTGRANNGPFVAPTLGMVAIGAVRPSAWSATLPWEAADEAVADLANLKPVFHRS